MTEPKPASMKALKELRADLKRWSEDDSIPPLLQEEMLAGRETVDAEIKWRVFKQKTTLHFTMKDGKVEPVGKSK